MLAKMARSAPSAAVRSVNGDDSRPRRQPGLPKRGENAKIRGGSEFIRRIPVEGNMIRIVGRILDSNIDPPFCTALRLLYSVMLGK